MPSIDYTLTTDTDLTKEQISTGLPRELTPTLELGKDNRTWNKDQLNALKLILCNLIDRGNKDNGVFLYSRKMVKKPSDRFNPHGVSPSSLIVVIDKLQQAEILGGRKVLPRMKGMKDLKLTSWFEVTEQSLDFAISLGINPDTVKSISRWHVRLRDRATDDLVPFEWDEYTQHIEQFMTAYCYQLNQHSIMVKTEDETDKGIIEYGDKLGGEHIHLYRSYRNYSDYPEFKDDIEKLWIDMKNPNFAFGGRSGSFWMSGEAGKRENRPTILINGNKTLKADFPCMHINLCYVEETGRWLQTENKDELKEQGRIEEDGYYIPNLHRDIPKKMILIMFNVKGRRATSMVFNKWIRQKNKDPSDNATDEQVQYYKEVGLSNIEIMDNLEQKHQKIKDYFYKGTLAGQIIQHEEANVISHLAMSFIEQFGFPVLTVYDELIVEEEHHAMVNEFMYTTAGCDICKKYSLMNQIKSM